MGADISTVQPRSQATPLAQDVLGILRGQLLPEGFVMPGPTTETRRVGLPGGRGGAALARAGLDPFPHIIEQTFEVPPDLSGIPLSFERAGRGLGPLQRRAGTELEQFISSGGGRFDLSKLASDLEAIHQRRTEEGVADLREGFGIAGTRAGTSQAVGEARFRGQAEQDFAATIGELFRRSFEERQNRLLAAINLLQNMGAQNLAPFFQLASLGILPEQTIVQQNPFATGLQALAGGATGAGNLLQGL